MEFVEQFVIFCTICLANIDSKHISEREKRFVLQPNLVTNNARSQKTPTMFPVPITANQKSTNGPVTRQQITAADLLNSVEVKCPIKRSTTVRRVLLDDKLMQELYLALFGNLEQSTAAGNLKDAETNFRHILNSPVNKTHHHQHHHDNSHKKSVFISDLKKYHSWYNSVLEQDHTINATTVRPSASRDSLEAILDKSGITKAQLKQLLGLVNEVDDIKGFRLSNKRVKRYTIGAVRSQTEYCNQRGVSTGTGYLHMCSACALTTQFPDDMFPRYVSEATCDESDCDCFTIKNTAHGKCQPMMKSIKMLRRNDAGCRMVIKNGQQTIVHNWELYEQPLHVGCECMFKKNSMFAAFLPKP